MKDVLLFVLPAIIFVCIFNSMIANQGKALKFVSVLFGFVCLSNLFSILVAFGIGEFALKQVPMAVVQVPNMDLTLNSAVNFQLPKLFSNDMALLLGLILGITLSFYQVPKIKQWSETANQWVTWFLEKLFIPFLPLFALGFIAKMEYEGNLLLVMQGYASIFLIIALAILCYVLLFFWIAAKFNIKEFVRYIQNVLPPAMVAFSTMSSMATMPLTLKATEKNTEDPQLTRAVIPATVNIHMVGDSIAIPILAMAILLNFGFSFPSITEVILFTGAFMLAKFAVPGVPCGTILVMVPILEKYLGFTPEMSAFITSVYILFDTINTVGNVLGNNALAICLSRVFKTRR